MFAKIAVFLIKFYRKIISPLSIGAKCRFVPTCSEYGIEAISKYGIAKGGLMLIKRLIRCNPLCRGGYDPVK